jgi:aspartate/methionine/tyrosine aminotransferase
MKPEPFVMERWQSDWENRVAHNLSESGVHSLKVRDLFKDDQIEELLSYGLDYGHSNGSEGLRAAIAALYPGARSENVVVTNGSAEANFISAWHLVEPGDEIVIVLPNYMQLPGAVRAFGGTIIPVHLRESGGWTLEPDALRRAVGRKTRLLAVCNPNNPTGAVLSEADMRLIIESAARVGCWVLADEIYRGAEREGTETPTFWGRYDRLLVTGGLSKAYGLPGLRIGWVVAPTGTAQQLWAHKDYTTIFPSVLSDLMARKALAMRDRILERTRGILRANYPVLAEWLSQRQAHFTVVPPRAGAIAYVRYSMPLNSTELVARLKDEQSVLLVAGDHFGMDGFLRIGFGNVSADLQAGLAKIDAFLARLRR